jgi:hypothetical protein
MQYSDIQTIEQIIDNMNYFAEQFNILTKTFFFHKSIFKNLLRKGMLK